MPTYLVANIIAVRISSEKKEIALGIFSTKRDLIEEIQFKSAKSPREPSGEREREVLVPRDQAP